ncbi:MAG: serine hydrolase [Gemmatimonadaceae bacterium]
MEAPQAVHRASRANQLYSNTGYMLRSIVLKRVSGQPLREFADEEIFRPLGMTNIRFRDGHKTLVKNRVLADGIGAHGQWRVNVPALSSRWGPILFHSGWENWGLDWHDRRESH